MNNHGQFHLLELGIGLTILLTLALFLFPPHMNENSSHFDPKIRVCTALAGIWTYNQGEMGEITPLLGLEGHITLEKNDILNENTYACTATRIRLGMIEHITIGIR